MTSILPNGGAIYDAPNIRKGAIYDAPKNREGAIFDAYKVEKISIFGREFISFLFMYTFYFYWDIIYPKSAVMQFMMRPKSPVVQFVMHPKSGVVQFVMHHLVNQKSVASKIAI